MSPSYTEIDTQEYLDFVLSNSNTGDARSVISAIDEFASTHLMMHIGSQKGKVIDDLINQKPVQVMIELGGYLGYSAVRFANQLPTKGHYYSFELNPEYAKTAQKVIDQAGLSSKVTIIIGEFRTTSQDFLKKYAIDKVDFAFIDHWKDVYVQDLKIIEELQWLHPGAFVVADNILFPGVPEYKAYIEGEREKYISKLVEVKLEHPIQKDISVTDALLIAELR
ncbi:hypothetical protein K7432_006422 [Basidiobolus ranarum]|uniref:catechol O-methyltransferase n=1 Tax=Basidiobolus ranarum TaxID=34480 RepID=A0ABR2WV26_9FUNG